MMVPEALVDFAVERGASGEAWLARLPGLITEFTDRWGVEDLAPLEGGGSAAWVGGGRRDGVEVVLKLTWPHPEAATEGAGLRFFARRGAVGLLESDESEFALLVERCRPGEHVWTLGADRADPVAVSVLGRLWREPEGSLAPIGSLADTVAEWNASFPQRRTSYPREIVAAAAEMGTALATSTTRAVVVHGDFNPFNVLSSDRDGWLAIDPKPLVGDPAYDLAQYLGNWVEAADASGDPVTWLASRVDFFAGALGLDADRIAGWTFVKSVGWNWGPRVADLFKRVARRVG